MNIIKILEILMVFFEFNIAGCFFKDFIGKRKAGILLVSCYAIIFTFIPPLVVDTYAGSPAIKLLVFILLCFLLSLMFKGSLKLKFFGTAMFIIFFAVADIIAAFGMKLLGRDLSAEFSFSVVELITTFIISKLMLLLILKVVTRLRKKNNKSMPFQYWLAIVILPLISIFIVGVIYDLNCRLNNPETALFSTFAIIGTLYINFFVFQLFEVFAEKNQRDLKERLLKNQVHAQIKECERLECESIAKRSFLHDLRHHNQLLFDLVKKGNADKALDLISKMLELNEYQNEYINTGNSAINALFNTHLGYAESQGIKIDIDDIHLPVDIELEIEDICIIFANSLENAIEACKKVDVNKRFIKIALKYRESKLVYKIVNSTNGIVIKNKNGYFKSTKTFKGEHGVGLENIEKAVDKYGGVFTANHSENVFTLGFSISFIKLQAI